MKLQLSQHSCRATKNVSREMMKLQLNQHFCRATKKHVLRDMSFMLRRSDMML